jgi:hypothetical protein
MKIKHYPAFLPPNTNWGIAARDGSLLDYNAYEPTTIAATTITTTQCWIALLLCRRLGA